MANVNAVNKKRRSALSFVVDPSVRGVKARGSPNIFIDHLMSHRADDDMKNNTRRNILERARDEGCREAADFLKKWKNDDSRDPIECEVYRCVSTMDSWSSHSVLIGMLTYLRFPCLHVEVLFERDSSSSKHHTLLECVAQVLSHLVVSMGA